MMTERENAREKAMVKYGKMQDDNAKAEVAPDVVIGEADRGPLVPAGAGAPNTPPEASRET